MKITAARLLGAVFAASVATASAQACTMGNVKYDDLAYPGVLAVHADIISAKIKVEGKTACLNAAYKVREVLFGQHSGPLTSSTCYRIKGENDLKDFKRDFLDVKADNPYAFNKGSEVIAVLTKEPPPNKSQTIEKPDTYRIAVPYCWGPMHPNLASFPEQERPELLQAIRNWRNDSLMRGGKKTSRK